MDVPASLTLDGDHATILYVSRIRYGDITKMQYPGNDNSARVIVLDCFQTRQLSQWSCFKHTDLIHCFSRLSTITILRCCYIMHYPRYVFLVHMSLGYNTGHISSSKCFERNDHPKQYISQT